MGYYIKGPVLGKTKFLVDSYGGEIVAKPERFEDIPEDKALIFVVNNVFFDAARLVFSQGEMEAFTFLQDPRPKKFVLMDKKLAWKLSGYNPDPNPYVPE